MKVVGRLIKNNKVMASATVRINDDGQTFRDNLQSGLIAICGELHITIPIWMQKNTAQLAAIRKVTFDRDQFIDDKQLKFDRFEFSLE